MNYGFFRACALSPRLKPADVDYNCRAIEDGMDKAAAAGAALALFPELSVTGYTCADLFQQERLLRAAKAALRPLAEKAEKLGLCAVVGLPLAHRGALWNCAAVLSEGRVAGIVPKSYLPNYKEYYESRWFSPGAGQPEGSIEIGGTEVPFGTGLLFEGALSNSQAFLFGIEIWCDTHPKPFGLDGDRRQGGLPPRARRRSVRALRLRLSLLRREPDRIDDRRRVLGPLHSGGVRHGARGIEALLPRN